MAEQQRDCRKRQRDLFENSKASEDSTQTVATPQTNAGGLDPEVLAELPPEIRAEVLAEQAREQHTREEAHARAVAKKVVADAARRSTDAKHSNFVDLIETVVSRGGGQASLLDLLEDDDAEEPPEAPSPPSKLPPQVQLIKALLSQDSVDILHAMTPPPGRFRLLSWNIDGLDEHSQTDPNDLSRRTAAVCNEICRSGASAVLLQEVVAASEAVIRRLLGPMFHVFAPRRESCPYFCLLLLQRGKMTPLEVGANYQKFPNSTMGRGLLSIAAIVGEDRSAPVRLCTAHLESTKPCTAERQAQLVDSLAVLAKNESAILAGDLNLRDDEAKRGIRAAEQQCPGTLFLDAWELCGAAPEKRFTWDPNKNTNGGMIGRSGGLPKCRFDRVLLATSAVHGVSRRRDAMAEAAAAALRWRPREFSLVGQQNCAAGRFPSDHWGLLVEFEVRQT